MITIADFETSKSRKNRHHLLSPKFGGHKSNTVNTIRMPTEVHDEYNRLTKGGCIPAIRFISQNIIRSIEHAVQVIDPEAIDAILESLTPMDWRRCYKTEALAVETQTRTMVHPHSFNVANQWKNVIEHEEYITRRAISGILRTKNGPSKNTALLETMRFLQVDDPMEAIHRYIGLEFFCKNLQMQLRSSIQSIIESEPVVDRTVQVERAIAAVLIRQKGRLKAVEDVWFPMDQYDVCLQQAVDHKYGE